MSDARYDVSDSALGEGVTEPREQILEAAGGGRRFANFLIDYLCYMLLAAIIGFGVVIIWGDAGLAALEEVPDIVLGIIVVCVYYIPLEAMSGRTIGKLITGTKVVSEDGHRPSFSEVIKRTLSRFIPFEAFSFLGKDSRGWHDTLSKTYVVRCR